MKEEHAMECMGGRLITFDKGKSFALPIGMFSSQRVDDLATFVSLCLLIGGEVKEWQRLQKDIKDPAGKIPPLTIEIGLPNPKDPAILPRLNALRQAIAQPELTLSIVNSATFENHDKKKKDEKPSLHPEEEKK
jgi:hypothetical protein